MEGVLGRFVGSCDEPEDFLIADFSGNPGQVLDIFRRACEYLERCVGHRVWRGLMKS